MPHGIFTQRNGRLLALTLTVPILIAGNCDGGSGSATPQNCTTVLGDYFPTSALFTMEKPATCPIALTAPATLPFTMVITFNASTIQQYYAGWVTDRQEATVSSTVQDSWTLIQSGTKWEVQLNGSYSAGHGGYDAGGLGFDKWHHEIIKNGYYRDAVTTLAYKNSEPGLNVSAFGGGIAAYSQFTIEGATTDDPYMIGPVTFSWYQNGTYVGSSSTGSYSFYAGDAGTETIYVEITDANSLTHGAVVYMTVCPDMQETC